MKRLMLVQYSGNYLEAHRRIQQTGTETYYGHRYLLEQLERVGMTFGAAAVLCCHSGTTYRQQISPWVTVMGASGGLIRDFLEDYDPTHVAIFGPMRSIFRWGQRANRRVMGVFADSFETSSWRRILRYGRLNSVLNDRRTEWVANHGVNACLSLSKLGVTQDKIIPWDWPHMRQPKDRIAKVGWGPGVPTVLFAGAVIERKGVGDLIRAVAQLGRLGVEVRLKIAGAGEIERFQRLACALGVGDSVEFVGLVSNAQVANLMEDAAVVAVPSQHAYPEGMPLTIYEALCARTPIVASDHPMFSGRLVHRKSAMIYPASHPVELAERIRELLGDRTLYVTLSESAQSTWDGLQLPVKWGDLLFRWMSDRPEDLYWLKEHRLNSGRYTSQVATGLGAAGHLGDKAAVELTV